MQDQTLSLEEQVNQLTKWLHAIEEVIQDEPEIIDKIIQNIEVTINEDIKSENFEENFKYEISLIEYLKNINE